MIKRKSVCFSGYRPDKFAFPFIRGYPEYARLLELVRQSITDSIDDGYEHFLVGMTAGFDLTAASVFFELKDAGLIPEKIRLTAVLPFTGHRPTQDWLEIHRAVLEEADEIITVTEKYSARAFLERNRFMVDRSSRLICYYTGLSGGTAYTVRYARKSLVEIVNVADWEAQGNRLKAGK